ncbi:hypothetical protein L3X38_027336 [Prunus dulcis]|uniref:Uncharacterized protein n=1 Tax=Prunus dulcis TaxID=3755 RepID=A0AAD4Z084_PRUDU|nr:hypothetical protein L3X38_027336 [Prunus dulcis]
MVAWRRRNKLRGLEDPSGSWHEAKEIMLKVVAMAMALPNHAFSCLKLPFGLCNELKRQIANYWWKKNEDIKGNHWVAWKTMKRLKKHGSMGFRDLEKYFEGKVFMVAEAVCGSSWGWK